MNFLESYFFCHHEISRQRAETPGITRSSPQKWPQNTVFTLCLHNKHMRHSFTGGCRSVWLSFDRYESHVNLTLQLFKNMFTEPRKHDTILPGNVSLPRKEQWSTEQVHYK